MSLVKLEIKIFQTNYFKITIANKVVKKFVKGVYLEKILVH
jgi:hypothetical protein